MTGADFIVLSSRVTPFLMTLLCAVVSIGGSAAVELLVPVK